MRSRLALSEAYNSSPFRVSILHPVLGCIDRFSMFVLEPTRFSS